MTKKKLDTSAIFSELSGKSKFFERAKSQPESEKHETVRPVPSVRDVQDVRHVRTKRIRKRHAFDIYQDQLEKLKRLKSENMLSYGEDRSMSQMVREALDSYLDQQ